MYGSSLMVNNWMSSYTADITPCLFLFGIVSYMLDGVDNAKNDGAHSPRQPPTWDDTWALDVGIHTRDKNENLTLYIVKLLKRMNDSVMLLSSMISISSCEE